MTAINIIYYLKEPCAETTEDLKALLLNVRQDTEIHIVSQQECHPSLQPSSRSLESIHWQCTPSVKDASEAFNIAFDSIQRKERPVLFVTDEIGINCNTIV